MLLEDRRFLEHMLDHSREARDLAASITRDRFDRDPFAYHSIARVTQIIGEAAYRISRTFKSAHPSIPWGKIEGFRHHLVHDYFAVDYDAVWRVATEHVLILIPQLEQLLDSSLSADASTAGPLPVAVIGCGRMGRLHARVYSEMPQVALVGVFDVDANAARAAAEQYKCAAFTDLTELLGKVAAVTIAVPTKFHLALAEPFLKRGIPCLIEKPLAQDLEEGRRIVELSKQHNAAVQVGHIERFNPVVRAMSKLNMQPRFIEVIRISPMTFRSLDVGVVLDMMIHDIDIVLRLADSKVAKIDAVGVSVIGDVEDICNARITFENGCVANLTASRLAMKTDRKLRIFSSDGYVSIDYAKRQGIVVRRGGNLAAIRDTAAKIKTGEINDLSQVNYAELVHVEQLTIDDVEPLRAQLDAFVSAIQNSTKPPVTAEDGLAAVELAKQIVGAIVPQKLES